jgi:hypothetical protein
VWNVIPELFHAHKSICQNAVMEFSIENREIDEFEMGCCVAICRKCGYVDERLA